ncbi:hypothetical protein SAJA_05050 [Salinisphaera japonica YTM-1]|uniref:Uncharacterized protein n=1 Tax=Salinisphaera japonica YTM-1 TaxID=1209778 RepID=A0A423PX39_9GAMM|nr:hypothetical protein SAJA_05050 [Salinisphaera japonica YTM-1]
MADCRIGQATIGSPPFRAASIVYDHPQISQITQIGWVFF